MKLPSWNLNKVKAIFNQPKFRFVLGIFIVLVLGIASYLIYVKFTKIIPQEGGRYIEGVVAQPEYLNPLLATSQVDLDLTSLIFSGLTKFDRQGEIVPDLAYKWTVSKDKKTYTFYLRENAFWHDGEKVTAKDIVFTIGLIQHPDFEGPLSKIWEGVRVKKDGDYKLTFSLRESYPYFLGNTTIGILPHHVLGDIDVNNIKSLPFNLNPIGSGIYKLDGFNLRGSGEIESIDLSFNENWYGQKPYIRNLTFKFYPTSQVLVEGYQKREILGISQVPFSNLENLRRLSYLNLYTAFLPQYTALFFNQRSGVLSSKDLRLALAYATNREDIVNSLLLGEGRVCFGPILEGFPGYNEKIKQPGFSIQKAKSILTKAGFKDNNKDGILEKGKTKLQFSLIVLDAPTFVKTAEMIGAQWSKVGVKLDLQIVDKIQLEECLEKRNFHIILAGQNLGRNGDFYPYWHSLQCQSPGLNLSCFSNKKLDLLLEETHTYLSSKIRNSKYQEIAKIIVNEVPAIFLYSPNYIYGVASRVKGIELSNMALPQDRFIGIESWYIKYKREFKK